MPSRNSRIFARDASGNSPKPGVTSPADRREHATGAMDDVHRIRLRHQPRHEGKAEQIKVGRIKDVLGLRHRNGAPRCQPIMSAVVSLYQRVESPNVAWRTAASSSILLINPSTLATFSAAGSRARAGREAAIGVDQ